ncbi:MAG: PQQ-dependent sugar dehydrogenase [Anaerolineales bacterium]
MRRTTLLLLTLTLLTACALPTPAHLSTPLPAPVTAALSSTTTPPSPPAAGTSTPAAPLVNVAAFPDPALFTWENLASGLDRPVDIQNAGDGSGWLFVIEKAGRIRILQGGQVLSIPFLDISDRVGSEGNEQGLLGLAFHPRYPENGFFYVNYTGKDGNTVIARYQVTSDPLLANPASERVLLRVEQPFRNHNGGALIFGPDGYLYAGLGDGGSSGDPFGNAQNLDTLLGKILRLDVDSANPYTIPPENASGSEVWAYGLRNPWRIAIDRLTGDVYIGDVGQDKWEEINFVPAGAPGPLNFGWDYREGNHYFRGFPPFGLELIPPVAEYGHHQGCSVTGGVVYRGSLPEWQGIYLYADYCRGTVWGLLNADGQWQTRALFETGLTVTTFGQDEAGEVYFASDSGQILRLRRRKEQN